MVRSRPSFLVIETPHHLVVYVHSGIMGYYRDPMVTDRNRCRRCPQNAFCAGDSVPGTTLLPVPMAGYWSNRSDLALIHYIHQCPRGAEVCIGGLVSTGDDDEAAAESLLREVVLPECWLPDNLTSTCTGDEALWCGR